MLKSMTRTSSEILELSQLTSYRMPYARRVRPRNITPTSWGPGDNSNRSVKNRTSKKKYIQNEIRSEKPDYASSAKFSLKGY